MNANITLAHQFNWHSLQKITMMIIRMVIIIVLTKVRCLAKTFPSVVGMMI